MTNCVAVCILNSHGTSSVDLTLRFPAAFSLLSGFLDLQSPPPAIAVAVAACGPEHIRLSTSPPPRPATPPRHRDTQWFRHPGHATVTCASLPTFQSTLKL
ncbi:hypothetical protein HMPREF0291_10370 [Corynebacterium genitalium ATCC 33030]|uniref:Uncharacterized protein n=1 Tax=Corynebacterium genitalium ATCC 33030 TaxID=585529 RepID=D7WB81_9CORY|nr:hypothetical protein HMPREF0291_10370 [Corynebacterium genitalium ATCC 33030]